MILSPETYDSAPKQVFVINDIDLRIPPSAISIQQEDLVYQNKSLRTKSTTKTPSGHGYCSVQVNMYFKFWQVLDLHRLVVELRHSPFCYVENRFLRESIVPEWPRTQNMAFTCTGFSVAPLPGSTDVLVVQLDLQWFNYQPFTHNFLYRKDWMTEWLWKESGTADKGRVRSTIGWDIAYSAESMDYERIPVDRIVATDSDPRDVADYKVDTTHRQWDPQKKEYEGKAVKTIDELEALHPGEFWDIQPGPDMMVPAHSVMRPADSRIYVRYINHLQRDSLYKHFGIRIDTPISPEAQDDVDARFKLADVAQPYFFGLGRDDRGNAVTLGLHRGSVYNAADGNYHFFEPVASAWREASAAWVREMNEYHGRMDMAFCTYMDIRMPQEHSEAIHNLYAGVSQRARDKYGMGTLKDGWFLPVDNYDSGKYDLEDGTDAENGTKARVRKRPGISKPKDTHVPIGTSVSDCLGKLSSPPKWRSENSSYSGGEGFKGRMHWGHDFGKGVKIGDPVYAIAPGTVRRVVLSPRVNANDDAMKNIYFMDTRGTLTGSRKALASYGDQKVGDLTMRQVAWLIVADHFDFRLGSLEDRIAQGRRLARELPGDQAFTSTDPALEGIYIWREVGQNGRYVLIDHEDGSFSYYMHLASATVTDRQVISPDEARAGFIVGYVGNTGPFEDSFVAERIKEQGAKVQAYNRGPRDDVDALGALDVMLGGTRESKGVDLGYDAYVNSPEQMEKIFHLSPHLHFEFWEKESAYPDRVAKYKQDGIPLVQQTTYPGYVVVDINDTLSRADGNGTSLDGAPGLLPYEEVKNDLGLDPENAQQVMTLLQTITEDGWYYYDEDKDIMNVWFKPHVLHVERGNAETIGKVWRSDRVIMSNMGGGLRHVVANIPVLGQEYPTQQHLGSIEPFYTFEFLSVDPDPGLAGVSDEATAILGMRSVLQHNARRFRPIVDGWCLAGDTFITRLLGSYHHNDVQAGLEEGNPDVGHPSEIHLRRRLICTRASSDTLEGQPGVSAHLLEMSETNPYEGQKLNAEAPGVKDIEEARKIVLNAVYHLEYADKYSGLAAQLLLAQLSGNNVDMPENDGFNMMKLPIEKYGSPLKYPVGVRSTTDGGNADHAYIADPDRNYENMFGRLGVPTSRATSTGLPGVKGDDDWLVVDLNDALYYTQDGQSYAGGKEVERADRSVVTVRTGLAAGSTGGVADIEREVDGYVIYDLTSVATGSQEARLAAEVPFSKIAQYANMLRDIVTSAEMMISENQDAFAEGDLNGQGLSPDFVDKELYGLGVEGKYFRYLSTYMYWLAGLYPERDITGSQAQGILTGDDRDTNWLVPKKNLTAYDRTWFRGAFNAEWNPGDDWGNALSYAFRGTGGGFFSQNGGAVGTFESGVMKLIYNVRDAVVEVFDVTGYYNGTPWSRSGFYDWSTSVHTNIADGYRRLLPLARLALMDKVSYEFQTRFIGPILGSLRNGETGVEVFDNETQRTSLIAGSAGLWWASVITGDLCFSHAPPETATWAGRVSSFIEQSPDGEHHIIYPDPPTDSAPVSEKERWAVTPKIYQAYTKFVWPVSQASEERKVAYFKQLLAKIADDIRGQPDVLRAFGLEQYGYDSTLFTLKGRDAYPDLDLPFHPYYGDQTHVGPDFYMWNIYQDGQALTQLVRDDMRQSLDAIITESHKAMQRFIKDDPYRNYDASKSGGISLEPAINNARVKLFGGMNPEGTDGTGDEERGPTSTPFYPIGEKDEHIDNFFKKVGEKYGNTKTVAQSGLPSYAILGVSENKLRRYNPWSVRLGIAEGAYGAGSGVQYPSRVEKSVYDRLKTITDSFGEETSMFGHRAGYLEQEERDASLDKRVQGTKLAQPSTYGHKFDLQTLKDIAWQSSSDIVSQKMMMRRAYPTFKLYFIEEDEYETRLLNFDDFYSYNGVVSFTVVQDRESPADEAIITVQNISGVLDGTKNNALTDLDYMDSDTQQGRSRSGLDAVTSGTSADQPFGAIVLRPGLNVQLRAGFSNDPDELEVLINGRVVDVTWNKQMDQAELMVQSFGTELMQHLKGAASGTMENLSEPVYTTHHLLGTLMLEPELMHFGRWEFGKLFQVGEAKDARLDFHDYARDGFAGKFNWSTTVTKWMLNHTGLVLALAVGGELLLNRIPGVNRLARFFTKSGGFLAETLAKLGITSNLSTRYFRRVLVRNVAERAGERAVISGATQVTLSDARRVLTEDVQLKYLMKALHYADDGVSAGVGGQLYVQNRRRATEVVLSLFQEANKAGRAVNIDELSVALVEASGKLKAGIMRGHWMVDPLVTNQAGLVATIEAVGTKPVKKAFVRGTRALTGAFLVAGGIGIGMDLLRNVADSFIDRTVGRVQRYFRTSQVKLFLSPQDDNLYPPHPKDYMIIPDDTWAKMMAETWEAVQHVVISGMTGDDQLAYEIIRWKNREMFDKRARPESWQYKIKNSYIWDVFHEMALRHPGWIYGVRPYGKEFRYTMFFGVPSQRYWARGASNAFVSRQNDLYKFLANGSISEDEYRRLYGGALEDGTLIDTYKQDLTDYFASLYKRPPESVTAFYPTSPQETRGDAANGLFTPVNLGGEELARVMIGADIRLPDPVEDSLTEAEVTDADIQRYVDALVAKRLGARAIEEYKRGLAARFVPFRRYHSVTSDTDIVWNGIMGSENASYNAVEVTYLPDNPNDSENSPHGTALFKAHAFIPEHKLRVNPLKVYDNCRGYQMAMRYAMGTMLFDMRKIYRGEIVVLGNPRIRPWDMCVLSDTYNNMSGPFEVEQVVHNFSHETGFITELKPAAAVFANEISGYPILTALKALSVAMKDIEGSFVGARHSSGSVDNWIDWAVNQGSEANREHVIAEANRMLKEAGWKKDNNDPVTVDELFSGDPPSLPNLAAAQDAAKSFTLLALTGAAITAMGAAYKGTGWLINATNAAGISNLGAGGTALAKTGALLATGATFFAAGSALASAVNAFEPPSLMWLLGAPLLMLNCLRGDSIILVPLIKSGQPVVAGLSYHDPSMLWNEFKGELARYVDDYVSGTRSVIDLWSTYGTHAWRALPAGSVAGATRDTPTDVDLTGATP